MDLQAFLDHMNSGKTIKGGSEAHLCMCALSQEALQRTAELNGAYHTPEEVRRIFSALTGRPVDDTFTLFPPFHTDCGKNIAVGKNIFINSGCKFQDQGGIVIGDGALIGHNVVLATLNHSLDLFFIVQTNTHVFLDPHREKRVDRFECDDPARRHGRRRRGRCGGRRRDEGCAGLYGGGRRAGPGASPADGGREGTMSDASLPVRAKRRAKIL